MQVFSAEIARSLRGWYVRTTRDHVYCVYNILERGLEVI